MAFVQEKREALHLLQSIENGTLRPADTANLIEGADPALIYLVFGWLRARYGADHPAAGGVIGRLVELTNGYRFVTPKVDEGKTDPVVAWFEEVHTYREFDATEFVDVVVEKLEG